MSPIIRIFSDVSKLTACVAQVIKESIDEAESGQYFLSLAGGNTPRALYQFLAEDYVDKIAWSNVQLFWGDERYVPVNDPRSNFRMVQDSLLRHVTIPTNQIHPIPTNYRDPGDAAREYEITLRKYFHSTWPRFDLTILGLGNDGHTASIFPGSTPLKKETTQWVIATQAPAEPKQRITLTLSALSNSKQIFFIVTGSDKANALAKTLRTDTEAGAFPAAALCQKNSFVTFWIDQDAARLLSLP